MQNKHDFPQQLHPEPAQGVRHPLPQGVHQEEGVQPQLQEEVRKDPLRGLRRRTGEGKFKKSNLVWGIVLIKCRFLTVGVTVAAVTGVSEASLGDMMLLSGHIK